MHTIFLRAQVHILAKFGQMRDHGIYGIRGVGWSCMST